MSNDAKTREQLLEELQQNQERLRLFLDAAPDFFVELDHEGKILFASRTYEGVSSEEVIGTSILDWLPEQFRSRVTSALASAWASGARVVVDNVRVPNDQEELWYSVDMLPVRKAGETRSAILVAREITKRKRAEEAVKQARRDLEVRVQERTASLQETKQQLEQEISERKRVEQKLRESEQQLVMAQRVARMGFLDWNLRNGQLSFSDDARHLYKLAAEDIETVTDLIQRVVHPDDRVSVKESLTLAAQGLNDHNIDYRLVRADGEVLWAHSQAELIRDAAGKPERLLSTAVDITERKRSEETLVFLQRELDHRVKNTLAMVASVAANTLRSSTSLENFAEAFQGRIRALARMHEAGAHRRWTCLPLGELVELMIAPFGSEGGRVSIAGEAIALPLALTRPIGMALHELAANAAKHGALSASGGRVEVSWKRESAAAGDGLQISWAESGGPPVEHPPRRGNGRLLIEEGIAYELGGSVEFEFSVTGVRCNIRVPLSALPGELEPSAGPPPRQPERESPPLRTDHAPQSLSGVRVIIVENDYSVAQSLSFLLDSFGCTVTGIAGTLDAALNLIADTPFDVAVLDIELTGTNVVPVAARIRAQGRHIIYITGYENLEMLPEELRSFPCLGKPVDPDSLISTLRSLLSGACYQPER